MNEILKNISFKQIFGNFLPIIMSFIFLMLYLNISIEKIYNNNKIINVLIIIFILYIISKINENIKNLLYKKIKKLIINYNNTKKISILKKYLIEHVKCISQSEVYVNDLRQNWHKYIIQEKILSIESLKLLMTSYFDLYASNPQGEDSLEICELFVREHNQILIKDIDRTASEVEFWENMIIPVFTWIFTLVFITSLNLFKFIKNICYLNIENFLKKLNIVFIEIFVSIILLFIIYIIIYTKNKIYNFIINKKLKMLKFIVINIFSIFILIVVEIYF